MCLILPYTSCIPNSYYENFILTSSKREATPAIHWCFDFPPETSKPEPLKTLAFFRCSFGFFH